MQDKNLLKAIYFKVNNNDISNYNEITELNLFNKSFSGKILNMDLREIIELKGLKSLSLNHFIISNDVIESLNKLENLRKIEFNMCDFKTDKTLKNKIQEVIFYSCKTSPIKILNDTSNIEKLTIINSGFVNIADFQIFNHLRFIKVKRCNIINLPMIEKLINLEYLYLNNIELEYEFNITKMNNLRYISFNGSKYYNKILYTNNLKKQNTNLVIEWEDNDFPKEYYINKIHINNTENTES